MKERVTITLDKNLLAWLDSRVGDKTFANRSHAVEYLVRRRMDSE